MTAASTRTVQYSTLQREGKGKINNQAKEREEEKETTKINITTMGISSRVRLSQK